MKAVKQRPFAFSCALFLLASVILFFLPFTAVKILMALFVLAEALLLLLSKKPKLFSAIFLIPPLIIASAVSFHLNTVIDNSSRYHRQKSNIEFTVTDTSDHGAFVTHYIKVTSIDGNKAYFNSMLSLEKPLEGGLFSSYSADAKMYRINREDYNLSSCFSFFSNGILLKATYAENITPEHKTVKLFPDHYFKKINLFLSDCFEKHLSEDANSLCQAFMLGNRDKLSDRDIYNFRKLGLSHMLAVSGLHLSLLCSFLEMLLKKTKANKKTVYIFMIFAVIGYAGITGFSSSVKRAAIMLILYYASFLISKNHDSITALLSAAALICLISPYSIFDIGLWLSFTATYGIVAVASPINKHIKSLSVLTEKTIAKACYRLLSLLLFGAVPVMFSLPVVWLSYQELAVLSPISNIIFTPLLMGIMFVSPLLLLCSPFAFLAQIPSFVLSLLASVMLKSADLLADHSPIVSLSYGFTVYIITSLVVAYLVISLLSPKNKTVYFVPFICAVILFSTLVHIHTVNTYHDQRIVYSNTESGDGFLAVSQNKGLWIDISGMSFDSASSCRYFLKKHSLTRLYGYVVTDYSEYGTEALISMLSSTEIGCLYLPKPTAREEMLCNTALCKFAENADIKVISYDLADKKQISFFGIEIDIKRTVLSNESTPSSFVIKLSNDINSLSYVGKGAHASSLGMNTLIDILKNEKSIVFGTYGQDNYSAITPHHRRPDSVSYYASDEIKALWNSLFLEPHNNTNITSGFEFVLVDN